MSRRNRWLPFATAAAWAMIAVWVAWWVVSLRRDALVGGTLTWVPLLPTLAADFTVHIDHVARLWASGINPYQHPCDLACSLFPYPPMIPRLFVWVSLVSTPSAVRIWLTCVAACLASGAWAAWRTRRTLGLIAVSRGVVLAAVLFSTPAVVAMERGQCDPLVIPALIAASALLRRRSAGSDLAAGGLLGLSAWLKYYPALTLVGLIALRRWRAASVFVIVAGLIGLIDRAEVRRSIENGAALVRARPWAEAHFCHPTTHSLVKDWRSIAVVRRVRWLRTIPPALATAGLLGPVVIVVSLRVARARQRGPLIWPYLLWLSAAATFAMPYSVDYNLVPLILAALAVWDRRDGWAVHAALLLGLATWWQPLALPLAGETLLLAKLGVLHAVAACLCARSRESSQVNEQIAVEPETLETLAVNADEPRYVHRRYHPDRAETTIGPVNAGRTLGVDRGLDAAPAGLGPEPGGGDR